MTTHTPQRSAPMVDIVALCHCLRPHVTATSLRQCRRIVSAMLVVTGRVTMLGLSRWASKGGSYRTVQRFFATCLPWGILFWVFFRQHLGLDHGVGHLVSMTTEQTNDSRQIGIAIR